MKLSNSQNLPQPLYDAVKNDPYSNGGADISVTSLLKPPRQRALEIKHSDQITEDAADRIWSLMGQIVHGILERASVDPVAERRLTVKCLGWTVSGGMDAYYDHGLVQDYKVVTSYRFKGPAVHPEYEQQLNLYAHILRENGFKVSKLEIVGILRDWSTLEAKRDPNYPQKQVVIKPVPLWEPEKAKAFLEARVKAHQDALKAPPACSDDERWSRSKVWAVMKPGRKTAVKLHDSVNFAFNHISTPEAIKEGLYIIERPVERIRCQSYCRVAQFCTQYQEELKAYAQAPDGITLTSLKGEQ